MTTTTINRCQQPEVKNINTINLPLPEYIKYPNGLKTAFFEDEAHEIIKIECLFPAGLKFQNKALLSNGTLNNLREGTKSFSAEEINESFDFYGSQFYTSNTFEYTKIGLLCLKKNFEKNIQLLAEIILHPTFPQEKLTKNLAQKKQTFLINKEKVTQMAKSSFFEHLFGSDYPYGIRTQESDYDNITRADLIDFHQKHYQLQFCKMIVSGKIDANTKSLIKKTFGTIETKATEYPKSPVFKAPTLPQEPVFVKKENALQSAIMMGKIMPMPKHKDFSKIKLFTTILGGYFGSRLMKNIREDKGYTYGIGASLVYLSDVCFLSISSEVKAEFNQATLNEIDKELQILQTELISQEELNKVVNYIQSVILQSLDGSFTSSNTFSHHWFTNDGWWQLDDYINALKTISPEDIKEMANTYFKSDWLTVVAG